jgi:hypothetical protein
MSDTYETHITIHSAFPHLPTTDTRRKESDEKELAAHWAHEARLGFPLTAGQKDHQRRLMALSGVVATTGHELTKAGAKARAEAAAKEPQPKARRAEPPAPQQTPQQPKAAAPTPTSTVTA